MKSRRLFSFVFVVLFALVATPAFADGGYGGGELEWWQVIVLVFFILLFLLGVSVARSKNNRGT